MISLKSCRYGVFQSIANRSVSRLFTTSSITHNEFVPATPEQEAFVDRKTEKGLFSRKTYLADYYRKLYDNNEILLFVHANTLSKPDNMRYRKELENIGARLHVIKTSIFKLVLKSLHEPDPAAKGVSERNKENDHPLLPLLGGPTAIIAIPKSDPSVVTAVLKVLRPANEKLLLIGAKVESEVMDLDAINAFKVLPSKETLQGQLVGLLSMAGGAGLVRTLQTPSTALYLNLDQRKQDMEEQSN
ncbi:MRPL11 54S ribosomal protein L11 [Candida maltosa Xu316]|uniref:Mitochondrial ribosomal protein, large subunit, putative n=1 Tax=Candida maltosa (strain Xu316) TaxID=1245528 RepID=M3HFB1_CANMX|nr:Mitochondrial ribosomal protein, large subunit, putative [Candida maltosa Xu316]